MKIVVKQGYIVCSSSTAAMYVFVHQLLMLEHNHDSDLEAHWLDNICIFILGLHMEKSSFNMGTCNCKKTGMSLYNASLR